MYHVIRDYQFYGSVRNHRMATSSHAQVSCRPFDGRPLIAVAAAAANRLRGAREKYGRVRSPRANLAYHYYIIYTTTIVIIKPVCEIGTIKIYNENTKYSLYRYIHIKIVSRRTAVL